MSPSDPASTAPTTPASAPSPSPPPSPILFFDHVPTPTNPRARAVFSHWYPSPFADPGTGLVYPTAEHYLMHSKALLFDPARAPEILADADPARAQAVGRELRGFDRGVWSARADGIVERANYLKFGGALWGELRATRGRRLVEASPTDRTWGIGFGVDEARGRESEWGENRMGRALERARERLWEEKEGGHGVSGTQ